MFECPKCALSLGDPGPDGVLQVICVGCRFKFQVLQGRLTGRSGRPVAVQGPGWRTDAYRRDFELSLELPGRREPVCLRVPGKASGITVRRDDIVSVTQSMDGDAVGELLVVENHSTGERFTIDAVETSARNYAVGLAFLAATFVWAGLGVGGAPPAIALLTPLVVLFLSWFLFARLLAPRQRLTDAEQERLKATQSLLDRKRTLEEQRDIIARETGIRSATAHRLLDLKRKMESVGLDAYQPRIALIDRALAGMEEQLDLDRQLGESYARAITMLEIEHESGLAEDLELGPAEEVVARLDQLRQLKERHAEITRELDANAEVERLLSGER